MITIAQVTEHAPHEFVAEASDLYEAMPVFRQGWPGELPTNLGNRQPFIRERIAYDREGDVTFVLYKQLYGCCSLKVFND
jgi:hypothetical protein